MDHFQRPWLITFATAPGGTAPTDITSKFFVSSLARSLFGGQVILVRNHEHPLFKVERKQIDEFFLPIVAPESSLDHVRARLGRELLYQAPKLFAPQFGDWVICADASSLAIRNIDHLLPAPSGSFPPADVDFYWTPSEPAEGRPKDGRLSASPGFWAVRAQHLMLVLELWRKQWTGKPVRSSPVTLWSELVQNLPLRKKRFERGEVIAPRMDRVNWEEVSNASVVTLPEWPATESLKFLQALYYGCYLGDQSGMMLNVLEG